MSQDHAITLQHGDKARLHLKKRKKTINPKNKTAYDPCSTRRQKRQKQPSNYLPQKNRPNSNRAAATASLKVWIQEGRLMGH